MRSNKNRIVEDGIRNINPNDFPSLGTWNDKAKFLLKYAILAPSTHNSQPWLFKISDNQIDVHYNIERQLPKADPKGRDLHISLGCCIENIHVAAEYCDLQHTIIYYSEPNETLRASIKFFDTQEVHLPNEKFRPLLESIVQRRNARGFFDDIPVDKVLLQRALPKIEDGLEVHFITDKNIIQQLGVVTLQGIRLAYNDSGFRKEMSKWVHNNFSKAKEGMLGQALRMPNMMSILFPALLRYFNIGQKVASLNGGSWKTAQSVCVIGSRDESYLQWIKVGRLAERLMLELPLCNLRTSIFVAGIEFGHFQKRIQSIVGMSYAPQFLFCVGYMTDIQKGFSPRFFYKEKILI